MSGVSRRSILAGGGAVPCPFGLTGGGGTERSVLFEGEGGLGFELHGYETPRGNLGLLSDGSLFYLVSCLSRSVGSEFTY